MGDLNPEFEGTWRSTLDPFHGYLKIEKYQGEEEGGECVAVVHAKHGKSEPPQWWRGVWKPTDMGFEAVAGPFHWKHIAMFSTPKTEDMPVLQYFNSHLNGWGWCNMGKLNNEEEQKFVDSLEDIPEWQEEKTFWEDYPTQGWEAAKKHMAPRHIFDGKAAKKKPSNGGDSGSSSGDGGGESGNSNDGGGQSDGANGGSEGKPAEKPASDSGQKPSDGNGGNQQQAAPKQDQSKQQPAEQKKAGNGADKDGDGRIIDDVVTGRVFKKDKE